MRTLQATILVLLLAVPTLSASDASDASLWASRRDQSVDDLGGYMAGYFDTILDKFLWSEADRKSWGYIMLSLNSLDMLHAMDAFYSDPANAHVYYIKAERVCLESLIAKLPEGPKMLKKLKPISP